MRHERDRSRKERWFLCGWHERMWRGVGDGKKGGLANWSRGHGRERVRVGKLVCLWFLPCLLWWPWIFRHLGGETRGENIGGGPGPRSGCCCHFSPMVASENAHVEVVDKLLQHGATIHIQDRVINNPIMSEFW